MRFESHFTRFNQAKYELSIACFNLNIRLEIIRLVGGRNLKIVPEKLRRTASVESKRLVLARLTV